MNKDKLQVGDLVILAAYPAWGIGLVINDHARSTLRYRVYWFGTEQVYRYPSTRLTKLSPTQEEPNE